MKSYRYFSMFNKPFTLALFTLSALQALAQDGTLVDPTNTQTRASSAALEVYSTNQGFLAPRVSLTQTTLATPVSSPAIGLLVFNTNPVNDVVVGYYFWNGTSWQRLINGNGTFPTGSGTLNYVAKWTPDGTTLGNSQLFDNGTHVGIGTASPSAKLHVSSNAGVLNLEGTDHSYIQWYPDGLAAGRKGYTGYPSVSSNDFTIANEISGAHIALLPTGTGNVGINSATPAHRLDVVGNVNAEHLLNGPLVARPKATWSASGTTTGAVIIKLPGTTANYGMLHMQIDVYEYNSNGVTTFIIGGHNWNDGQWHNYNCHTIGNSNKKIRLAVKDGQFAVVLGEQGSTWSYGHVVLSKITNGGYYSGVMNLAGSYTITQDNSAESYSFITANLSSASNPSVATNYIQNQFTSAQNANYWVSGNARIQGNTYIGTNANKYFYPVGDRIIVAAESTTDVAEFASYGLYLPKTNAYNLFIGGGAQLAYSTAGYIDFKNEGGISTNSGTLNMYFKNTGNVGVGTTAASVRLHVAGNAFFDLPTGGAALENSLTIKKTGQPQVNFGSYPGAWTPALQIQNNDNSRYVWLSPLDNASGGNARLVTGGSDFAIMPSNTLASTFHTSGDVTTARYHFSQYFNSSDNSVGSGVTGIMVKAGDNYFRTGTAAAVQSFLGWPTYLKSPYPYNINITDATTAATLSEPGSLTSVNMHASHGLFGGWATTLTMSGYERYGAYQISGNYNNAVPELAIRNYVQSTNTWNSWVKVITTANVGSYGDNLGNHTATAYLQMGSQWINFNGGGLYSSGYGNHFWPANSSYWNMNSNYGMHVRRMDGTSMGYLYHDNSSSFGLLSPSGSWRVRVDNSSTEVYGSAFYAPTSYIGFINDRDNSNYYLDPSNYSVINTVRVAGGSPAAGKVLTSSDANGNATWEYPSNGWEYVGDDARVVCNGGAADLVYEWGVTYNNVGTILRVTCNTWNTGYRVCSYPPYPTGDSEPFRWGGVCFIWNTYSTWDDACSRYYHSYYYQSDEGKYEMWGGNGCDQNPGVYRRKL